jgi:hypothetical protein
MGPSYFIHAMRVETAPGTVKQARDTALGEVPHASFATQQVTVACDFIFANELKYQIAIKPQPLFNENSHQSQGDCCARFVIHCTAAENRVLFGVEMSGERRVRSSLSHRPRGWCQGDRAFVQPLFLARRVLEQERRQRGRKVYSLHAPEVKCIGKGKAHQPYELGVKVSIHAVALPGNPYDGHTLATVIPQMQVLIRNIPDRCW